MQCLKLLDMVHNHASLLCRNGLTRHATADTYSSLRSASYRNVYREWIGAQIRADFFGYANPGNPEKAAEMAWRDASISHVKNGIYGEMWVAAMLAAATVTDDIKRIVEAGLAEVPAASRLADRISDVIAWKRDGVGSERAIDRIHEQFDEYNEHHWCHTISNAMIVTVGLLYGELDFERSIGIAVSVAFDTDCNDVTVGSIVGLIRGAGLTDKWTAPLNETIKSGWTVRLGEAVATSRPEALPLRKEILM
jgi:ADP-ribosylglycohydrolase